MFQSLPNPCASRWIPPSELRDFADRAPRPAGYRREVIVRWFASLADRFFASDHGLTRFRYASQAVLSVILAVLVLGAAR
ncbi:MAG: hypothetical protein QOI68_3385, partial [Pseudonocardiales bacterium]|nr:hypothetical protein [Pseudonocardiales bacterium]